MIPAFSILAPIFHDITGGVYSGGYHNLESGFGFYKNVIVFQMYIILKRMKLERPG